MQPDKISTIRDAKDSMQWICPQIYSQIRVHDPTRKDQIKKLSINLILNEVVSKLGKALTRSRTKRTSLIIKSYRMTNKLKTLNHLDRIGMTYTNSSSWQRSCMIKIKMDYLVQVRGLLPIKNLRKIEVFKMMTMMILQ